MLTNNITNKYPIINYVVYYYMYTEIFHLLPWCSYRYLGVFIDQFLTSTPFESFEFKFSFGIRFTSRDFLWFLCRSVILYGYENLPTECRIS